MSQLHFICIYSIVGLGLMLLVGFTGQISLGHAAFLAVGAYTEALLQARGVPFFVSLPCAALLSAAIRLACSGLPALRLKGIYLAIATLAFNVIVEEIIARWEGLTGGNSGLHLKPIELFGIRLDDDASFYYLCLALDGAVDPRGAQPAALAHRPRLRRDPRLRDLGLLHGRQPGDLQDAVVRPVGGAHRHRRRALRAQGRRSSRPSSSRCCSRSSW